MKNLLADDVNAYHDFVVASYREDQPTFADRWALLEREHYDLVLLDLMLPDGSGEDLLPQLNTSDRGCIPVIIFSADDISPDLAGKVAATLVKSRTSNESLAETIQELIRASSLAGGSIQTAA